MDIALISFLTSFLTAIVTGAITYFGFWRQAKAELRKEFESRFNQKKWDVYVSFSDLVKKIIGSENQKAVEDAITTYQDNIFQIASQLILIGSDDVVRSFHDWRVYSTTNGQLSLEAMEALFRVISAMRKDLGNESTKIDLNDMLGSLVPNYRRSL